MSESQKNNILRLEENVKTTLLNSNFNTDESNEAWDIGIIYLIFLRSIAIYLQYRFIR